MRFASNLDQGWLLVILVLFLLASWLIIREDYWGIGSWGTGSWGWADRPQMSSSWDYYPSYWGGYWRYGYGSKRGMSRDLRGDPYIPYYPTSPWNQPSRFPLRNRQMIMG